MVLATLNHEICKSFGNLQLPLYSTYKYLIQYSLYVYTVLLQYTWHSTITEI